MTKDIQGQVISYQRNYILLNLNLFKYNFEVYNEILINYILYEYNRGFIFVKILKATCKGTKINFESIKNKDEAYNKLINIAEKYNIKIEKDSLKNLDK